MPSEKTIGVLGGMGPEATAAFFQRLVVSRPVPTDQEHFKIVIINNPKIPDRSAYLQGRGPSPIPLLEEAARDLERLGAGFIAIPCNTAHLFWDRIQEAVQIPVLHIVKETVSELLRSGARSGSGVGVLATSATIASGLYQEALEAGGRKAVTPSSEVQELISDLVYRIKSGGDKEEAGRGLSRAIEHLGEAGADSIIYGCTELGLAPVQSPIPIFDSVQMLVRACLREAACDSVSAPPG